MENFIVYKITGKHTNKTYYGKTMLPVEERLSLHLSSYRHHKETYCLSPYLPVFDIIRENNNSDIKITTLTPGSTNYFNATAIEKHYIEQDKNCCNKNGSDYTVEEYLIEYSKKHSEINK